MSDWRVESISTDRVVVEYRCKRGRYSVKIGLTQECDEYGRRLWGDLQYVAHKMRNVTTRDDAISCARAFLLWQAWTFPPCPKCKGTSWSLECSCIPI
jgi:hypothetical protein